MTLGDIISEYRATHSLSMAQFAERSGISKAYISMLERNRTQRGDIPSPSIEVYRSVACALGIDVDELIRRVDGNISLSHSLPSNILPMPKMVKKPRLGTIACGRPILAVEEADEFDLVPEDIVCDFTLRCKGDSMIDARICDGDIVYIRIPAGSGKWADRRRPCRGRGHLEKGLLQRRADHPPRLQSALCRHGVRGRTSQ